MKNYRLPKTRKERIDFLKAVSRGEKSVKDLLPKTYNITMILDGSSFDKKAFEEKVRNKRPGDFVLTMDLNA